MYHLVHLYRMEDFTLHKAMILANEKTVLKFPLTRVTVIKLK